MKDIIRAFVAVTIDAKIQKEIGRIQDTLMKDAQKTVCRVSWVKPETIHLTIKFLGDIPVNQVDPIMNSLRKAVEGINAFSLKVEGLGVFPSQRNPRVVWVGISEGKEALQTLQPGVEKELADLGFPREKKKFNPHLTLGRVRSPEGAAALGDLLASIPHPVLGSSIVKDIRLMKSDLHPTGAVHTELGRIQLG
jgi:RNA 2',3'-cyclic 3'-phosphodiesterase